MRSARHLVIFLKAPIRGAVKTRLAKAIGRGAAWRFYRDTSLRTVRDLAGDPRWICWLAVTPDNFAWQGRFWPANVCRLGQGGGDLGARMARSLRRFAAGPVVIVGSDIPDLRRRHIAAAFQALGRHHTVFGPASDGGYWLVGLAPRAAIRNPFRGVAWSTDRALAETRANLPRRYRVALLETLDDIDDGDGWRAWRAGQA
ncbi:MAG: TIGR04282 family arsenosugar biosynthesis glycosyltransferase [Alphaproteobacteria bacterium]